MVATYVAELRQLAEFCEFGTTLDKMIRDRLVCGINYESIQKRLFAEQNLTYKRALEIAQGSEEADRNLREMKAPHGASVTVKQEPVHQVTVRKKSVRQGSACYRCGAQGHKAAECKFKDKVCHSCHNKGHLAKVCQSKTNSVSDTATPI